MALLAVLAVLLAASPGLALGAAPTPVPLTMVAPFDIKAPTPHRVAMAVDTSIARDILTIVSGSQEAPAALKRIRASEPFSLALEAEHAKADQYYGRLASAAAGSPDPLFQRVAQNAESYREWLTRFDEDGVLLARASALRVASILPASPAINADLFIIPVFGLARFGEVDAITEGDKIYFIVDLERLMTDTRTGLTPREALLKVLRTAASSAWKTFFEKGIQSSPAWAIPGKYPFDTYLTRTVSEGPPTLFLIPDEFLPLSTFLEEPVSRSFESWNRTAETLLDEKKDERGRKVIAERPRPDDLWSRHTSIVGAQMTEAILRKSGRTAFIEALAAGPQAVAALYVSVAKEAKLPDFAKTVKKYLEARSRPASTNR